MRNIYFIPCADHSRRREPARRCCSVASVSKPADSRIAHGQKRRDFGDDIENDFWNSTPARKPSLTSRKGKVRWSNEGNMKTEERIELTRADITKLEVD